MTPGPDNNDIVLKRSGKRARLEITLDDLEPETARLPAARLDAPARGVPAPRTAAPTVQIHPRPAPSPAVPPPGGFPPTRYVHDGDDEPWWRTRAATWTALGVLVAALAVVAALLLFGGDDSSTTTADQLEVTRSVVLDTTQEAGQATKLVGLRAAGRASDDAVGQLVAPEATLKQIDDARVRAGALDLIAAERGFLQALGALRRVDAELVAESGLGRWTAIKRQLRDRQAALVQAGTAVAALKLPSDTAKLALGEAELDSAIGRLDRTVVGAHDRLVAYRRGMERYQHAVTRARRREARVNAYRGSVQSVLSAYAADRKKVDAFAADASSYVTTDDVARARELVDGFVSDRQRTVSQLKNTLSSAPESVRSAHANLVTPLDDSLRGLSDLYDALSQYEYGNGYDTYGDLAETPAWTGFQDASDSATTNYDRALSEWSGAVDREVKAVKGTGIPDRPAKPQV